MPDLNTHIPPILMLILLGALGGCGSLSPRNPVPVAQQHLAVAIPQATAIRAWSGALSEAFESDLVASFHQQMNNANPNAAHGAASINVLTLSGGADYGAFGAGFMNGWSLSGRRPEFKIVTGISTGALIAPFAFLGPRYDGVLKQAFTTVSAKDIFITRWLSFLWLDAFADTKPLAALIEKYMDEELLAAVAQAHNRGRRLYIGTTHLDADRLVVWNMGAIANSGDPHALQLFRKVILASASVPVAFPPVLIDVSVGDAVYDEMHVDGGVKAQLFLTAATIDIVKIRGALDSQHIPVTKINLFIIRNAITGPVPKPIARDLSAISERAIDSLIKSQARSDLERVYAFAQQRHYEFNWVAVPAEYPLTESESFDRTRMNRLFLIGDEMGRKADVWRKTPPGLDQQ